MTNANGLLHDFSDEELLRHVVHLARQERHATAQLIASLTELDSRKLYLREGCASLFTYCTQVLHLSEHAAYGRIEAARAARRFPTILELLVDGSITLTTVTLIGPHLTGENHRSLLEAVRRKSRREVEHIVARLRPKPDAPTLVRKLPEATRARPAAAPVTENSEVVDPRSSAQPVVPARPPFMAPLSPARYKIQFTVSVETYQTLRRAQDLLRHVVPNGDPAAIFDRALTILVEQLEKTKWAATTQPRASRGLAAGSRHIPAAVRRVVWARDGGQCTFRGAAGRCTERGCLEFHHVVSYAAGGPPTVENIVLRCRSHNQYEASQEFPLFVREGAAAYLLGSTPPANVDNRRCACLAKSLRQLGSNRVTTSIGTPNAEGQNMARARRLSTTAGTSAWSVVRSAASGSVYSTVSGAAARQAEENSRR